MQRSHSPIRGACFIIAIAALLATRSSLAAASNYQVTFDSSKNLQNVFIYADEFNGEVYAWDLFPIALGDISAGTATFDLGNHDLKAWAILARYNTNGVAPGINDSIDPPDGLAFEDVFPGYSDLAVAQNIANLYVNGAYNVEPAYYLTEFVLAVEDTLKTDRPTGSLSVYTFSGGANIGTATFNIVQPRAPGDLNCDNKVDFNDIDPFVVALIGQAEYQSNYPNCNYMNGDINADGAVNFNDIDGFVDCLIHGGCP